MFKKKAEAKADTKNVEEKENEEEKETRSEDQTDVSLPPSDPPQVSAQHKFTVDKTHQES